MIKVIREACTWQIFETKNFDRSWECLQLVDVS